MMNQGNTSICEDCICKRRHERGNCGLINNYHIINNGHGCYKKCPIRDLCSVNRKFIPCVEAEKREKVDFT